MRYFLLLILWASLAGTRVHGAEKVWTAVLLATNAAKPKPVPPQLAAACAGLQRILKYNQFEILGSTTNVMDEREESWMVPSDNFWLRVKARRGSAADGIGTYLLDLELFHDKRPLVETEAKLGPSSPLFIRGPVHSTGQVLIVLMVQP